MILFENVMKFLMQFCNTSIDVVVGDGLDSV